MWGRCRSCERRDATCPVCLWSACFLIWGYHGEDAWCGRMVGSTALGLAKYTLGTLGGLWPPSVPRPGTMSCVTMVAVMGVAGSGAWSRAAPTCVSVSGGRKSTWKHSGNLRAVFPVCSWLSNMWKGNWTAVSAYISLAMSYGHVRIRAGALGFLVLCVYGLCTLIGIFKHLWLGQWL